MSDPGTNVDVEDVLSSIRRLVSDTKPDDRQETKAPEVSSEVPSDVEQEAAKPVDALILTSALRVKTLSEDSVPEFRHADMTNFRQTLTDDTQSERDGSKEPAAHHADWSSLANDDYYEDDVQPEPTPVIDFIRHSRRTEPAAAGFSDANNTWEPELVDEVEPEQGNPVDKLIEDAAKTSEMSSDERASEGTVAETVKAETTDIAGSEQKSRETDADEASDEWRVTNDADPTDDASLIDESVFASAAAASVIDGDGDHDTPNASLADFDDSVIDEAVLRDLVAEIVRQELTGELGERITRNVRKLVRREIHRALLTREFE
ncbi:hypothetical protein BCF46_0744 [Litoreibacter meonggei]|uniref:Uncharacterized protein n=1 Tax=Litoreibacter meonggei TaxID=1049199 RepID=A0A497X5Q8_9RHOB|nr:hypothetical protein [Litoreibacter meonggei]RLJ60542.1 hypothetical protein BCF46_0744 [Litoreibacter meonggei]